MNSLVQSIISTGKEMRKTQKAYYGRKKKEHVNDMLLLRKAIALETKFDNLLEQLDRQEQFLFTTAKENG